MQRHQHSLVLILALGICCFSFWSARANEVTRPNVLFVAVDDLNDWIGVLGGHPQARTPNIDRLAKMGVLFTNAHTAAPACNPSRVALMTGIPPHQSGVYHNNQRWRPALPDADTIPQTFQKQGYWAAGSGKIYHGSYPDPKSWDTYMPSKTKQKYSDPAPPKKNINGLTKSHFDWGPLSKNVDDTKMGDARTADWICKQLENKHERPFFLACGFYRPHLPWYVPAHHFEAFPRSKVQLPTIKKNDLMDIPKAGITMAKPTGDHQAVVESDQWQAAVQGYLASIAFVDRQVGRVIGALESGPNAKNTVIVFWTDHGWHLGEKQHWRKFTLWEEATRVPIIVVAPPGTPGLVQGTPKGKKCSAPVSLMDLYPSLLELCGLPTKEGISGESLCQLLADPSASRTKPALTTHGRKNHALRDERWRYIRYSDGEEELYDHQSDPQEWHNLAGNSQYDSVKNRLNKWLPKINTPAVNRGNATTKGP